MRDVIEKIQFSIVAEYACLQLELNTESAVAVHAIAVELTDSRGLLRLYFPSLQEAK